MCSRSFRAVQAEAPHRMAALVKKYGPDRIIVNSAADWGISDPLKVPKTIDVMRAQGIPDATIQRIHDQRLVTRCTDFGRLVLRGDQRHAEEQDQNRN